MSNMYIPNKEWHDLRRDIQDIKSKLEKLTIKVYTTAGITAVIVAFITASLAR